MRENKFEPSWDNCSTVIAGKNATVSGRVLLGHGEDDSNCICQVHKVPRMEHEEGEVLTFDDGTAVVPQVPVTWGYLWTELRAPGGAAFADGFVNEWGVAVVTNSCVSTKEATEPYTAELGYGMRRLIAERCKTAREGVEVVADLMKKYGYRSTRSYHIVDKDEAWAVQLTVGNQFAARRIGDDEIYYIPNWLTIHQIDFKDTEHKNFYWSEEVVDFAQRNGWYTPAVEGDYSDFDFALAYQGDRSEAKSNFDRSTLAWTHINGENLPYRTFSIKAPKKYCAADFKEILRLHGPEIVADPSLATHSYYGICRDTTVESLVVEFQDDADLTTVWRSTLRPCRSPFMPWFPAIQSTPKGWSWQDIPCAQYSHLKPTADEFRYHGDRAYWAFHMLNMTAEYEHGSGPELLKEAINELEAQWEIIVPAVRETYSKLKEQNEEAAKAFLTDYVHAQAQKTWDWAEQMTLKLVNNNDQRSRSNWRDTMK